MTTFVTHRGLYRYTRLMFGMTSAPEKYQQIIRDVLRGCEGVINIADDLVIHGNGVEQHDERLFVVLNPLKEVGLTLNGDKCEFRLPRLTFFGHQVTQNGVEPSEEKVAAIGNADPPENASEARSFLGLAQFVSKFIPSSSPDVRFRILMLCNHDVIRLQQETNIISTRFSGLPTLVTEHAWYCGMSRYINFR